METQEHVIGYKKTNGWIWCEKLDTGEQGWIPALNLKEIELSGSVTPP
ncbi:SH3 domain-containing protein [Providencia rettgeri]